MRVRWLIPLVLSLSAWGQTCTTANCTAASPNESDVLAALPSSSNTNSTVVVSIPSGTATWTTGFSYTVPSAVTNLTIQGNTTTGCTGTAGSSSYSCSPTDNTVLEDDISGDVQMMTFTLGSTSTKFRITGLTIQVASAIPSGSSKPNGWILFTGGTSQNVRVDDIHFNSTTYSTNYNQITAVRTSSGTAGVFDHNVMNFVSGQYDFGMSVSGPCNDAYGYGDGTFANATPWGQIGCVWYVESNYMTGDSSGSGGGIINDCYTGGAMVVRYNNINYPAVATQTHGTKSTGGPSRGCRSIEVYHNYVTGPSSNTLSAAFGTKGTTALFWGNTVVSGFYRFYQGGGDRQSGDEDETATPNGWGYCGFSPFFQGSVTVSGTTVTGSGFSTSWPTGSGTTGLIFGTGSAPTPYYISSVSSSTSLTLTASGASSGQMTVGSPWDGNQSTSNYGAPCLDGVGRGQDQQHLNGSAFPNRLNSVTGTIAWSEQYLEPQYLWDNSIGTASTYMLMSDKSVANQDYYYDCGSANSACSSFTGQYGTGYGLLASRPSTCNAGPGGTYGASPTGSYGVAYFATDTNELYVCTAGVYGTSGTWTGIYTPYTYPHPLVAGVTPPSVSWGHHLGPVL